MADGSGGGSSEHTADEPGGDHAAFLDGERPGDVLISLPDDAVSTPESLADHGHRVDGGTVLVLDGERGRGIFQQATGIDPMSFARTAMQTEGSIERDCTGGTCPDAAEDEDHSVRFVFAFAEAENPEVGGLYAEGDVIHAYAHCECGENYSHKWVVGTRRG